MKEILFRAKSKFNGEWEYGTGIVNVYENTYKTQKLELIKSVNYDELDYFQPDYESEEIIPETVGQFTGLYDRNGKRIFEGDIVSYSNAIANYQVMWVNYGFVIKDKYGLLITPTQKAVDYLKVEVIGNIYDNPELIKGENE